MTPPKISNTFQDCVWKILDKQGDRTSLATLCREATELHRQRGGEGTIQRQAGCHSRLIWRQKNGVRGNDCRTYETQFRRDMVKDAPSDKQIAAIGKILGKEMARKLATAILRNKCHSVELLVSLLRSVK